MNNKLVKAILTVALSGGAIMSQASDLGIRVLVSGEIQPGIYGEVEIGNDTRPPLVYSQPRIVVVEERYASYRPVYLHVPPGHAKHWDKHCQEYHACNRKVYFVRSNEYDVYEREHDQDQHHEKKHDHGNGKAKGHKGKH